MPPVMMPASLFLPPGGFEELTELPLMLGDPDTVPLFTGYSLLVRCNRHVDTPVHEWGKQSAHRRADFH